MIFLLWFYISSHLRYRVDLPANPKFLCHFATPYLTIWMCWRAV